MPNRQRMMVAAYKAHRVKGSTPQDGIFALAKEPPPYSHTAKLALEPLCLACDYMPLAYHIYNPPGTGPSRASVPLGSLATLLHLESSLLLHPPPPLCLP